MSKKLAKYEIEAMASQIVSTIHGNSKEKAKAGSAVEKAQAQVDAIVAKMEPLIAQGNLVLAAIADHDQQLNKLCTKLEDRGIQPEDSWADTVELDLHPSDKKSFVALSTPKMVYSPRESSSLQREIERAITIETLKKDFDVEALMEKLIKQFG